MFKLPKSFTDPTLHILSGAELFNPTKNGYYVTGRKYLTGPELLAFYKAVYTRENITANLNTFFPLEIIGGILNHDSLTEMLGKIDDADLWQFAFMPIAGLSSGNRIQWIKNNPRFYDYSSSGRRVDCQYSRTSFTNNYSYQGNNFKEEMTTALREQGTAFHLILTQYPDYHIALDPLIHGNVFLAKLANYSSNRKTWTNSEYTAESLAIEMTTNLTMEVRITANNYHGIKVSLVNPVSKHNKSALFSTLSYSADVLDLLPWPILVKGERDPITYGVELEVSTRYSTQQLIEATDEPFMAGKQDSSITGSMRNKVELVTAPMSMKAHKKEWSHFFSNLDYDEFDTTIDTNNGMHVHIGRTNFTDTHLRTFAWFFGNPCNRDFIIALSERKANQMHQYSAMPSWSSNTTKMGSLKSVIGMFDMLRGAVNLHKAKPTVEVRIFKGIASYATIIKNLEAVDAIFHFTQQCSQTSAGLKEFLRYISKTPRNKYPVLREFLATLDTKKMLSTAELNDILFNVSDPRQIISIIKKKNFPITSHHVTVLNQKQGVRTFIYNKEVGTIEIVRTKHGKMSHLDRLLEKKHTRNRLIPAADPPAPPAENVTHGLTLDDMLNVPPAFRGHSAYAPTPIIFDTVNMPQPTIHWDIPAAPASSF